jgi:hypothetical protein
MKLVNFIFWRRSRNSLSEPCGISTPLPRTEIVSLAKPFVEIALTHDILIRIFKASQRTIFIIERDKLYAV